MGVALAFLPDKVMKLPPVARWIIATVLVLLGGFGFASSIVQRREDGREKTKLNDDIGGLKGTIGTLQSTIGTLQATVNIYGPKLDFIINHPQSPEQKALALALQREMNPKVEIDEPNNKVSADPNMFQWTLVNTGGSVARDKANQAVALIAPEGRAQEETIFQRFYQRENEPGQRKLDMPTGYEHRVTVHVHLEPPSAEDIAAFRSWSAGRVLYQGR